MPELILQLSDLHVQVGRGDAEATERVERAIELVRRHCAIEPPQLVLITGDLVNTGAAAEFERLAQVLAPLHELGVPLAPLVGNHDDRLLLRELLTGAPGVVDLGSERHLQYVAQAGQTRVIVLDTQHTGHADGKLCDTRHTWLEQQLAADTTAPTLIAMHHPPAAVGLPSFDAIALRADHAERFGELVERHPNIERIVCGHVHRAVTTRVAHVPVFVCPSVFLPARPDLEAGQPITLVDGPVGIGVHVRATDGTLASHVRMIGPVPHVVTRAPENG